MPWLTAPPTQAAEDIADLLAPQSGAYYDVWLDGEKFMSSVRESPEVTVARDDNRFGTNFQVRTPGRRAPQPWLTRAPRAGLA